MYLKKEVPCPECNNRIVATFGENTLQFWEEYYEGVYVAHKCLPVIKGEEARKMFSKLQTKRRGKWRKRRKDASAGQR